MKNKKLILRGLSLLCLTTILLYPHIAYAITNSAGLSYVCTGLIFILPIVTLVSLISNKWIYSISTIILTILATIDLTMVDLYNEYLLPGGIISTIKTNPQEATEFYKTNLLEVVRWMPILILCLVACLTYTKSTFRKFKYVPAIISFILTTAFVSYKIYGFYQGKTTWRYYIENRILNRPPYNVPFQTYQAGILLKRVKLAENMKNIHMGAYRTQVPENKKEIYVFAIGESLRYDNLSLNGIYHRPTTPRLEQLSNLILFDDYYSQACLTMFSVPQLVTRATPDNYELNYAERSVVEPFRECGFKVFAVISETNLLSYEKYLTNGADSLIIVPNIVQDGEIISGDKTIVHIIDSLAQIHDKLFVITQFYGNHSFFTNYEKAFELYNPNSNNCPPELVRDCTMLINAYDNSILYTDYILSSLIKTIDQPNTVSALMFVSDHGENISQGGAGHGGDCAPTKSEYHVPFIFWWSEEYAEQYSTKINCAKQNKQAKINGDNIYYSVCDLADIQLAEKYNKPSWSVLSLDFEEHERLILVPDGKTCIHVDNLESITP